MAQRMIHVDVTARPLRTEADYSRALAEIEPYFDKEPNAGTPAADRFDLIALLIEDYERKHWPIDPPDAVTAIRYRMETGGFTQADLGQLLGSRQRASEILSGRRPISMTMAWRLHSQWGVPADVLIRPLAESAMENVQSKAVRAIDYRPDRRELTVLFTTGRTYVYFDVPAGVYEDFLAAESKGGFVNSEIIGKYRFKEVA